MFTLDTTIDAVQTGKKTFVTTFVTNETVKDAMIKFIDAQTEYTKNAVKAGTDTFAVVSKEVVSATQNASKFDYTKFSDSIVKAYSAAMKK